MFGFAFFGIECIQSLYNWDFMSRLPERPSFRVFSLPDNPLLQPMVAFLGLDLFYSLDSRGRF